MHVGGGGGGGGERERENKNVVEGEESDGTRVPGQQPADPRTRSSKMRCSSTITCRFSCLFHLPAPQKRPLSTAPPGVGSNHVFDIWAWGKGDMGQLGSGDENTRRSPSLVTRLEAPQIPRLLAPTQGFPFVPRESLLARQLRQLGVNVLDREAVLGGLEEVDCSGQGTFGLACGLFHSALLIDGEIWMWGKGEGGRLGLGSEQWMYSPTRNPYLRTITGVSLGGLHSAAVTRNGELYTWGFGAFGQLGHGIYRRELFPKKVDSLQHEKVVYVSAGGAHTGAITASGRLYTWGRDEGEGRLGHGDAFVTDEGAVFWPVEVETMPSDIAAVSCGGFFTTALTSEGQVWNWGANSNYELGRGDIQPRRKPSPVPNLENIRVLQVASGGYHSAALTENGKVLTWGHGGHGQLGHSSLANGRVPRVVEALADLHVVYVACGSSWTAAVIDTGEVYCWGKNRDCQLGVRGLLDSQSVPVQLNFCGNDDQLQPLGSAVAVAAGSCHGTCLFLNSQI